MATSRCSWLSLLFVLGIALCPPALAQRNAPVAAPLLQAKGAEQPIVLRSARVEGEVQAGIAQTRIELEFHNPNRRVLEAELQFPLAEGQQISGFALDIGGVLRDAVPVPKARGREVFEAITRRQVDPGLLEQTAGNQFRLRIYPLPAQGSRRVRIVVREPLPWTAAGLQWRLPLQFAQGAQQVALSLRAPAAPVGGTGGFAFDGRSLAWEGRGSQLPASLSWSLPAPREAAVRSATADGQTWLMAQVPVALASSPRRPPGRVGLLWDASGSSGSRDRNAELAVLDRYFAAMGEGTVALTVLRDRAEAVGRFPVRGGQWPALRKALLALRADGASSLASWTPEPQVQEYLLVSDGLLNYGPDTLPALASSQRLFALSSAGARTDAARLRGWSEAHGGTLAVVDGDVAAAARQLLTAPLDLQVAAAPGLHEVVIDRRSVAHGWAWVLARADNRQVPLRVRQGQAAWTSLPAATPMDAPDLVAGLWAQARVQQLALEPQRNADAISRLSQQFGLVSADTSLIVLETVEDYVRHGIVPPQPLRAAYDRLHALQVRDEAALARQRLDEVAAAWAARRQWWQAAWPKDGRPSVPVQVAPPAPAAPAAPAALAVPAPAPAPAPAAEEAMTLDSIAVPAARARTSALRANADASARQAKEAAPANDGALAIQLAAWEPDSPVAKRLRDVPAAQLYARYLDERSAHADSSAFFLDVAELLLQSGQRDLALRVLSNLAEMDLENRHLLRVLGYRLMQADAPALAVPVFERVRALAEEEPQSFRDLGLAQAAAGQPQAALASLYEVVRRPWDSRFNGVALIALDEMTTLVARSRPSLDTRAIDPRLLKAMPLDLRVVLSWDADNSDMDLWVTDPDGERAYYGNRHTYQGGLMSEDFTGGYGPEQFSLRDAKPGRYKVEANYFGSRQQLVTGATTLMLQLSTHWGSARQQDQRINLRLAERRDTVLVGEFEVR